MEKIISCFINYLPKWTAAQFVLFGLVCIAFYVLLIVVSKKKNYNAFKVTLVFLLAVYLILVYSSAVFSRDIVNTSSEGRVLLPFWSYKLPMKFYPKQMAKEIIMNVLMLMPIGMVFNIILTKKSFALTVMSGFLCSLSIELLQLLMHRGFFEFDDLMHNTLGTAIGWLLMFSVTKIRSKKV